MTQVAYQTMTLHTDEPTPDAAQDTFTPLGLAALSVCSQLIRGQLMKKSGGTQLVKASRQSNAPGGREAISLKPAHRFEFKNLPAGRNPHRAQQPGRR